MEQNRLLDIRLGGSELPDRPMKLLSHESYRIYGVEKVPPRNLSRRGCHIGIEEERAEHLEGAGVDGKRRLWGRRERFRGGYGFRGDRGIGNASGLGLGETIRSVSKCVGRRYGAARANTSSDSNPSDSLFLLELRLRQDWVLGGRQRIRRNFVKDGCADTGEKGKHRFLSFENEQAFSHRVLLLGCRLLGTVVHGARDYLAVIFRSGIDNTIEKHDVSRD